MIATYGLIHWPVQELIEDLKSSLCFIDQSLIHIAGDQVVESKACNGLPRLNIGLNFGF